MKKRRKRKTFSLKYWIIAKLRQASRVYPIKNEVLRKARVRPAFYECAMCKLDFRKTDVHVDHIDPVVSVEDGFIDWNTYVSRLFCEADKMQVLCKACHAEKTEVERKARKERKKLNEE